MAACVIPFPTRPPTDRKQALIDLIRDCAMQSWSDPAAAPSPPIAPPAAHREDEILKLLRRIDRRLARLGAVSG
jgi:hypothetical protein